MCDFRINASPSHLSITKYGYQNEEDSTPSL